MRRLFGTRRALFFRSRFVAGPTDQLDPSWTPNYGNIVAYYRMNGELGDIENGEILSATIGSNGTHQGPVPTIPNSYVAGQFSEGIEFFHAEGGWIQIGTGSYLNNLAQFSVSGWFYWTGDTGVDTIFSKYTTADNSANGMAIYVRILGGNFGFCANTAGVIDDQITATPTANTWTHFVCTYNGANRAIYFNGVLQSSDARTGSILNNPFAPVRIAASGYSGNSENFEGIIDDVAVWNKGLTAGEALAIYSLGVPITAANAPQPSNLKGIWHLNGTLGSELADGDVITDATSTQNGAWVDGGGGPATLPQYITSFNSSLNQAYTNATSSAGGQFNLDDGSNVDFEWNQPMTIMGWINTDNLGDVFNKNDGVGYIFSVNSYFGSGSSEFILNDPDGTGILLSGTAFICDSAWHHVAVTYNGSGVAAGVKLYIDGMPDTNVVYEDDLNTADSTLNSSPGRIFSNSFSFSGDEISVWDTELSAVDIATIYLRQL